MRDLIFKRQFSKDVERIKRTGRDMRPRRSSMRRLSAVSPSRPSFMSRWTLSQRHTQPLSRSEFSLVGVKGEEFTGTQFLGRCHVEDIHGTVAMSNSV